MDKSFVIFSSQFEPRFTLGKYIYKTVILEISFILERIVRVNRHFYQAGDMLLKGQRTAKNRKIKKKV